METTTKQKAKKPRNRMAGSQAIESAKKLQALCPKPRPTAKKPKGAEAGSKEQQSSQTPKSRKRSQQSVMLRALKPRRKKRKNRGRLARKQFSPGAHPAAETPFYIAAASVSARGDAQRVWSHESSISSSYERKRGSARSHIFTSVKTRRVKLVKLETNYKQ